MLQDFLQSVSCMEYFSKEKVQIMNLIVLLVRKSTIYDLNPLKCLSFIYITTLIKIQFINLLRSDLLFSLSSVYILRSLLVALSVLYGLAPFLAQQLGFTHF